VNIEYKVNERVIAHDFSGLLKRLFLAARRPVDDLECIEGMISNSNLVVTAWDSELLVGISRCITDFHYACYLSDLAVDRQYQRQGVGSELLRRTQKELGPKCKLILIAAPAADKYYSHIGFINNQRCWVLDRNQPIGS